MALLHRLGAIVTVAATAVALSACGSGDGASTDDGAGSGGDSGGQGGQTTLTMASDLEAPPVQFEANGQPTGYEIELVQAMAKVMNVKVNFVNTAFSAIITSVATGRYDFGMAGTVATAARQKQVDFVTYAVNPGSYLLVKAGSENSIDVGSLCGKTLAGLTGSLQTTQMQTLSKECEKSGKKEINIRTFSTSAAEQLAVKNGLVLGEPIGLAQGAYAVSQSDGKLALIDRPIPGMPGGQSYGVMFKKGSTELEGKFQSAINTVIKDGTYLAILKKYGIEAFAISSSTINPSAS